MPIYEYACENCGHQLEAMQKMSDDPLKTCPSCGADQLRKLVSAAGFRLKGSGWYETDFKGGKAKTAEAKTSDKVGTDSSAASSCSTGSCPAATNSTP